MAKRDDEETHDAEPEEVGDEVEAAAEEADEAIEAADAEASDSVVSDSVVSDAETTDAETADADADDADETADEAGAEPVEETVPHEQAKPALKPKVTGLTLTLCGLNVAAALGFVFMLMLAFEKRQGNTFAAAGNEFNLLGVGAKEDHASPSAGTAVLSRPVLGNDALRAALSQRGGSAGEPFTQVEEPIRFMLYGAGDVPPAIVRELMNDLGDPVDSIDAELNRLKTKVPTDVEAVGKELVTKMEKAQPAAKQDMVMQLLFPLCVTPMQVDKVSAKARAATGDALNAMLEDAVQRRILGDILWPVEMYRPSEPERMTLEEAADLDKVKLDDLRELLTRRLDAAAKDKHDGSVHYGKEWDGLPRGTIEKRQNAAFLLVSLAYARKHVDKKAPFEEQLLYPKGLDRAQRISGLYNFTDAITAYDGAVHRLAARVLAALELDRTGFRIPAGANEFKRNQGFPDKHADLIFQIRRVQLQIRQAEERLKDLSTQQDRGLKLLKERGAHMAEVEQRILQERVKTGKHMEELRELQKQLHRANVELATAAQTNSQLEERIRSLTRQKGAQP